MERVTKKGEMKQMLKITLKAARMNIGKTLKEAASEFGIHYETLSNYETDSTNVQELFSSSLKPFMESQQKIFILESNQTIKKL